VAAALAPVTGAARPSAPTTVAATTSRFRMNMVSSISVARGRSMFCSRKGPDDRSLGQVVADRHHDAVHAALGRIG
jgi:hypothetical protein